MAKGAQHDPIDRQSEATASNPVQLQLQLLILAAIAVRVLAALILLVGPWTDEAQELAGWDIERFVAIAEQTGRPWRDVPVEYPPGSVLTFEALEVVAPNGAGSLVGAHRALVVAALIADLGLAWMLARRHWRAGAVYLVLGLPLVPMGLLRLDVVVALLAVGAALAALPAGQDRADTGTSTRLGPGGHAAIAPVLTACAFMVKIWPALLIPGLASVRKDRTALAAAVATLASTVLWLWWADAGLDPLRQIVELRGATGWHLESIGGVVVTLGEWVGLVDLATDEEVRLELNAYRVGTIRPALVTAGRGLAVVAIAALALRARRLGTARTSTDGQPERIGTHLRHPLSVLGAVMLGSAAALIVTAPLISPQFLLWLTPWAALMTVAPMDRVPAPVLVTAAATIVTGVVLALFGPPDLNHPLAALALALRNGLLLLVPISCWRWLAPTAPTSGR